MAFRVLVLCSLLVFPVGLNKHYILWYFILAILYDVEFYYEVPLL